GIPVGAQRGGGMANPRDGVAADAAPWPGGTRMEVDRPEAVAAAGQFPSARAIGGRVADDIAVDDMPACRGGRSGSDLDREVLAVGRAAGAHILLVQSVARDLPLVVARAQQDAPAAAGDEEVVDAAVLHLVAAVVQREAPGGTH